MKGAIAIFSVFFVLMFYTGYKRGDSFVNDPNFLEKYAFSKIKMHKKNDSYHFSYGPEDRTLYWFDVDKNKLHKASISTLVIENANKLALPSSFILNDPSIPAALGGVTFGFGAKDILQNPKKVAESLKNKKSSRIKKLVAGILGMTSGYSAGYWVSTRGKLPELDDQKLVDIVKNEKKWVTWEIDILINIYSNLKYRTSHIEDAKQKESYEKLLAHVAGIALRRNEDGDLFSKDLETLSKVDAFVRDKYEKELEKEELIDRLFFYYIPWGFFPSVCSFSRIFKNF